MPAPVAGALGAAAADVVLQIAIELASGKDFYEIKIDLRSVGISAVFGAIPGVGWSKAMERYLKQLERIEKQQAKLRKAQNGENLAKISRMRERVNNAKADAKEAIESGLRAAAVAGIVESAKAATGPLIDAVAESFEEECPSELNATMSISIKATINLETGKLEIVEPIPKSSTLP